MQKNLLLLLSVFFGSLLSCSDPVTDGPYFGNGIHNGWANQHSVVIWTRLTEIPEGNNSDIQFLEISKEEHDSLGKLSDADALNRVQLPVGATLEDMHGACPGSPGEVQLRYYPDGQEEKSKTLDWAAVDPAKNYTHQWRLEQLEAGAIYHLELLARKTGSTTASDTLLGQFRTAPADNVTEALNFSIVSCHDYDRKDTTDGHKIYAAMLQDDLDFYLHTGDIEYYDKPNPYAFTEELMRFKWDRLFALPLQRQFYGQTTSYFMKDDHDILYDDAYQGMTYGSVSFARGLEIFDREQFPSNEQTYQTIRWGKDLQVWILEGRRYRSKNTDPDSPEKTILGEQQKAWLFQTVKASDAAFKVIVSASPILGPDRPRGKNDNHSNKAFQTEGDQLRDFFNQFDNVFLCNGDRHWQYVTHFENSNLWEFGCGAGSDEHAGGWKQEDLKPEHRFLRVKGGYLFVKLTYENDQPSLSFQHRDVDGRTMHEEVFGAGAALE